MPTISEADCTPARVYVQSERFGDLDFVKAKLKLTYDRAAHDAGRKGLYHCAAENRPELERLLAEGAGAPAEADVMASRVYAKVKYRGRTYFVLAQKKNAEGEPIRCLLANLDGKGPKGAAPEWMDCADCVLVTPYEPREFRGRKTYQTLGALKRFVERQRDPATARTACTECGTHGPAGTPCEECREGCHPAIAHAPAPASESKPRPAPVPVPVREPLAERAPVAATATVAPAAHADSAHRAACTSCNAFGPYGGTCKCGEGVHV